MGLIDDIINKHKEEGLAEARRRKAQMQTEVGKVVRQKVTELKDKGLSNAAIAEKLGIKESVVRSHLDKILKEDK